MGCEGDQGQEAKYFEDELREFWLISFENKRRDTTICLFSIKLDLEVHHYFLDYFISSE